MVYSNNLFIQKAQSLGFDKIGFTKAEKLDQEARQLEKWLHNGYHAEMTYMERYFDLRVDPEKLCPGTKTIIVMSLPYDQERPQKNSDQLQVARYAYGKDYHKIIRKKTKELISWMKECFGDIQARAFVDSGPVLERVWASKSGISWNGKNTLSIHPKDGSYFFLSCIFTDLLFEFTQSIQDHCGTCRRCIEACPTDAIAPQGYLLDASKCISYATIELKNAIPESFRGKMENWIFGCDICQEVCPWNRFSKPTKEKELEAAWDLLELTKKEWMELSDEAFNMIAKESPMKRTGLEGMKRNVAFLKKLE
ncbi:MAG: tRNA epoxyqueuosine(34) reductase QueG [Bacteroidota bacterium]|nr:tRNA epoxyqueuosine(34) reductase QueG [Bacteroidota bacterium]